MNFRDFYKNNLVILDGGMGTLLQEAGMPAGSLPERLNIDEPDLIEKIHKDYFDAGSNVVNTNTFGASCLKFSEDELEEIISAAVRNAKRAREKSISREPMFISLDIGPTGRLLKPFGDLDFEEAVEVFAKSVRLGVKYGVDLVTVETMNDSYETKAALLAVKENCDLPVIVTNAYGEDEKLMTGASAEAMCALLEGMGADIIGANCSLGPDKLVGVAERLLACASVPVALKPNAGMPSVKDGKTVYDIGASAFSDTVCALVEKGVRVVGGCCGTTPEYIKALASALRAVKPRALTKSNKTVISSFARAVEFGGAPVLIGERLNPTGKKRFREAIQNGEIDYILKEGIAEEEYGAMALDVNVGVPGVAEAEILALVVKELQAITPLPLVIDSSSPEAIERAARIYNGKPLINSVNGKRESMEKIFPIAKKYGAALIALTLDESGIPKTAEGRVRIAENILVEAQKYGIDKKDIIFDTLTMAISADPGAAEVTLASLKYIEEHLDARTSLGVSNVSFGLPERDVLNASFFTLAMHSGLSGAIMNPYSEKMRDAYNAFLALSGKDESFSDYIAYAGGRSAANTLSTALPAEQCDLRAAIVKGIKAEASDITEKMLADIPPMEIVNEHIIPALDEVGAGFEKKTVYLPNLLMSAEAAKAAFERIKASMPVSGGGKGRIVIATVKGDIHDIGKNIVKLLLENYGFAVTDLGKDVPPEKIVETALEEDADIVALSALMTTTTPAMEETIKQLRASSAGARVIVGGAVLTEDYAKKIGADAYGKDAMESVRYAQSVIG